MLVKKVDKPIGKIEPLKKDDIGISLENANDSDMDAKGIMAMFLGLVKGERFCGGAIMSACKSDAVVRWSETFKTIVENE